MSSSVSTFSAEERAATSLGKSNSAIYDAALRALLSQPSRGTIVDLGCGAGQFVARLAATFTDVIGCDLVQYPGFPRCDNVRFVSTDLNAPRFPLEDASVDVVASLETIEHLENPRAFVREMARIVRPGGSVLITTPNQLSLLSKLTLLTKDQFNAFQESCYPAHITALVEADLRHIVAECGLVNPRISYTDEGRIPLLGGTWPKFLRGRRWSDNVLLLAQKPR